MNITRKTLSVTCLHIFFMMESSSTYRSKGQIIAEMLEFLSVAPQRKTRVMCAVCMSTTQLKAYVKTLVANGLILDKDGYLHITDKGRACLEILQQAEKMFTTVKA